MKTEAKTEGDKPALTDAHGYAASDYEDYDDEDCCSMCGGDGVVMLSDCGPSEWGEDCFCEQDRLVTCPECRERERYEQLRKQQEAKRHNAEVSDGGLLTHESPAAQSRRSLR